eukprot:9408125-Pyramimonas_sp.AAC.1
MISVPESGILEKVHDYAGATVTLVRGVEVPKMAFSRDSNSSSRNSQVDPCRWNPETNVLACFRIFERLSSDEAVPPLEMSRCRGL